MQKRILEISNFRNIGISTRDKDYNEKQQPQTLLLNTNLEADSMGGLVLIIGENNTGKSNVSKALSKFMFQDSELFGQSDEPKFLDCEDLIPQLSFQCCGGGGDSPPLKFNRGVEACPL
ncbi:hypothetical protein CQA53_09050 [Helicobacter didelphidarum]|uniref:AAA domain-containing protein n=1 Tax=Helicobacter didelphidarum TaxID=2040648 RepID=A0A3D8IDL5_9HELI|nr:hypothetical protein [Helicobacter didelphidarum]RDU62844.1 hypothetical protein CQA53_09050 [Helicobacter didelphidarum]